MIVEDSYFEAQTASDVVRRHGGIVLGPHSTTHHALKSAIDDRPTLALLDIDLNGKTSFLIADALTSLGVPLAFVSGYSASTVPRRFKSAPWIAKPATEQALLDGLTEALYRRH